MNKVKRDYSWCDQDFQQLLKEYNNNIASDDGEMYECVGYANVRMQFCYLCSDAEKRKGNELYYVNRLQVPYHKKNICHGCLGYKLRLFAS